jgi:hypothetical protein
MKTRLQRQRAILALAARMAYARRTPIRVGRWRALRNEMPHLWRKPVELAPPEPRQPPAPPSGGGPANGFSGFFDWLKEKAA